MRMEEIQLLISVALKEEGKAWRAFGPSRLIKKNDGAKLYECKVSKNVQFHLLESGMGKERALKNLQWIMDQYSYQDILFSGFCGALDARLKCGTVFLASECVDDSDEKLLVVKGRFYEHLTKLLKRNESSWYHGRILSVKAPLLNSRQKETAVQTYHAQAVDMENYPQVQYCQSKGLQPVILRFVLDEVTENLEIVSKILDEQGKLIPGRLLSEAVKTPSALKKLTHLGRLSSQVRQVMNSMGKELIITYFEEKMHE